MTYTEALLVFLVIYLVAKSCSAGHDDSIIGRLTTGVKNGVDKLVSHLRWHADAIVPVSMQSEPAPAPVDLHVASIAPTAAQVADTVKSVEETFLSQSMGEGFEAGSYLSNPFGAAGATFKDWMTSQAVDISTIRYHDEFIKDRIGNKNTQNVLGRTYSPDREHESDQIHWMGIRGRPQAVKTDNPTQVPDVNYDWYTSKPKLTWNSSGL